MLMAGRVRTISVARPMADKPNTNETDTIDASITPLDGPSVMSVRLRRIGDLALELLGDFFAVVIGLLILVSYAANSLLVQQQTGLSSFQPTIKRMIAQSFDGAEADFDKISLHWYPSRDTLIFEAQGVNVLGEDGESVQELQLFRAGLFLDSLKGLNPDLRDIEVIGGDVTWLEREDGSIIAGLGRPNSVGQIGPTYRGAAETQQRQIPNWLDRFETLSLKDSQVYILNETNGLDVHFQVNSLLGRRNNGQVSVDLFGSTLHDSDTPNETPATLALRLRAPDSFETVSVDAAIADLRPDQVAPSRGRFSVARAFALPISVQGSGIYSRTAGLEAIEIDLGAGAGTVDLAGELQRVSSARFVASLNTGEQIMSVSQISVASDLLSLDGVGKIRELGRISDGDIGTSPVFDLNIGTASIDLTPVFAAPLQFQRIDAIGQLDLDARSLAFSRLALRPGAKGDFGLDLRGEIRSAPNGLSLLQVEGEAAESLGAEDLLALWPVKFADGARRWIERSVLAGKIDKLAFNVDLDEAFFSDPVLTPERLSVDYTISNGTVRYISTMTPLTDAFASGRFIGNTLYLDLASGRIGDVVLTGGRVDIPQLMPKGGDILIETRAEAPTPALLALADQPPFEYLKRYGVSPDGFGGDGSLTLKVRRPLLEYFDQSRIEYDVSGAFENASAPFTLAGYSISQADVRFEGGKDGLFLEGPANLGPWRANVNWAERYGQNGEPTRYTVTGTLDATTLDAFGIPSRQILGGNIGVNLGVTGKGINVDAATLDLDLKDADLSFGSAWTKAAGEPGTVNAVMSRANNMTRFEQLSIDAPGLTVEGIAEFRENFSLESAELGRVSVEGLIDGTATLTRKVYQDRERLGLSLQGQFLNISDYVEAALKPQDEAANIALDLDAAFSTLRLAEDYDLDEGVLQYQHSGEAIESLVLSGTRPNGALTGSIVQTESGRQASLRLPDMSQALQAVYGIESTQGGVLVLDADLPAVGAPGAIFGSLDIEDVSVKDVPFLAQLLSLASLTGLLDTLSGEGLGFESLSTDFALRDRRLSLRKTRMSGPALGLTAEGEIDFSARELDLDGALVPAYTANSLLNDLPLIGSLFTDKDGEGVFALTYTARGPFDAAQITVNPLSALTPGFLRGIFRSDRDAIDPDLADTIETVRPNPPVEGTEAEATSPAPN